MKKIQLFLLLILFSPQLFSQININLNWDYVLSINEATFKRGELSLEKISTAIDGKYRTKRRKKPEAPHYQYRFKKIGIVLESKSYEEPSDMCSSITVYFIKKNKRRYSGSFELLGHTLSASTTFDEIFFQQGFRTFIR